MKGLGVAVHELLGVAGIVAIGLSEGSILLDLLHSRLKVVGIDGASELQGSQSVAQA